MAVKLNGKMISPKTVVKASIVSNWNDSMGCYYPYLSILTFHNETPQYESFDLGEHHNPYILETQLEYDIDHSQVYDYEAYLKRLEEEREFPIVRRGKMVRVKSGRKIPIGTTGIVFWTGATKFGTSVGIEIEGKRVFTSIGNVEVIKGV